jgi:hypothetical protein
MKGVRFDGIALFPGKKFMSLLNLFSRKKAVSNNSLPDPVGASFNESTQPMVMADAGHARAGAANSGPVPWGASSGHDERATASVNPMAQARSVNRKDEDANTREHLRVQSLARREQLYGAVRESLLRVGILAASYKFKVLALDQSGRQYLVMIDLASNLNRNAAQMAEVERLIAENAKSHYDLAVTAVYWRVDDQLGDGAAQSAAAAQVAPEVVKKALTPGDHAGAHFEPLQTEEMLAFKRALAVTATSPSPAAGVVRPPARGYSPLATGYEDTQVVSPDTRPAGLGPGQ